MFNEKIVLPVDESCERAAELPFFSESGNLEDHAEGQLSVDVAQTADELIVSATMAGTRPEDISLHLQNDILTIRGTRLSPVTEGAEFFYEECYWGPFSRTIVLPVDVRPELARSEYKDGVLTIRLPKAQADGSIPIFVVED